MSTIEKKLIDLSGPKGNVFHLFNEVKTLGKEKKMSEQQTNEIIEEMMSFDYEHALNVFEQHFKDVATLIKTDKMTDSQKKKIEIIKRIVTSLGFHLVNSVFEDFLHVSIDFDKFRKDLSSAKRLGNLNEISVVETVDNRLIYVLS